MHSYREAYQVVFFSHAWIVHVVSVFYFITVTIDHF